MRKIQIWSVALPLMMPVVAIGATVENVIAQQRPANNLVDIYYDLNAPDGGKFNVSIQITSDKSTPPLETLHGDVGMDVTPGFNRHIVWDAGNDWPGNVDSNMVAVVAVEQTTRGEGMVWIPAGINEGVDPDFGPYALTNSTGFWMDRTEVTYEKFKEVYEWAVEHGYVFKYGLHLEDTSASRGESFESWLPTFVYDYHPRGSIITTRVSCREIPFSGGKFESYHLIRSENLPVSCMTFADSMIWCNARSEKEGFIPFYVSDTGEILKSNMVACCSLQSNGYRLPTRMEWEYAARGGKRSCRFPNGNQLTPMNANYISAGWDIVYGVRSAQEQYRYKVDSYYYDMYRFLPNTAYRCKDSWAVSESEYVHPKGATVKYYTIDEKGEPVAYFTWDEVYHLCYQGICAPQWGDNAYFVDSSPRVNLYGKRVTYGEDNVLWLWACKEYENSFFKGKYGYLDEGFYFVQLGPRKCAGPFMPHGGYNNYYQYNEDCVNYSGMPVASYAPNGYGLYDMAGNLGEWVEDVDYQRCYFEPGVGTVCQWGVIKGGPDSKEQCRCRANNSLSASNEPYGMYGFRCIRP